MFRSISFSVTGSQATENLVFHDEGHEAQLFNYRRISGKEVRYVLNFGRKGGLEWKRIVVSDLHERVKEEH